MKKTIVLFAMVFVTLAAACQSKDHKFDVLVRFNQGIQFGDNTIQTTASTGTGSVTWSAIIGKPVFSAVAISGNYNDLLNKPEPASELSVALPSLLGIRLPVLTQTQINALTPVKGLLLFNDTDGVLQIYNGTTWKVIITNL